MQDDFGPIQFVLIQEMERVMKMPYREDSKKRWDFLARLKSFEILFIMWIF